MTSPGVSGFLASDLWPVRLRFRIRNLMVWDKLNSKLKNVLKILNISTQIKIILSEMHFSLYIFLFTH